MPRPPSDIWNHFTTYDDPNSRVKRARCHYCDHQQACSITRLQKHLSRSCPNVPDVVRQEITSRSLGRLKNMTPFVTYDTSPPTDLDDALQVLARASYNLPSNSATAAATARGVTGSLPNTGKFDTSVQTSLDWQLARAFFAADISFQAVEHPLFVQFFNRLNPNYKVPTHWQLQQLLLKREHWDLLADRRTEQNVTADTASVDSESEPEAVHMES
ncbi:unnamed protein product [Umbelopsis vinacea]